MRSLLSRLARLSRFLFPVVSLLLPATMPAQSATPTTSWVGTWGTSASSPGNDVSFLSTAYGGNSVYNNQTLRLIVHTSIGGDKVRVRLSNEGGTVPLTVGAVHVALGGTAGSIVLGSDQTLTFGGQSSVTIPAGAPVVSDPLHFDVPPLADLAVSIYLSGAATTLTTAHVTSIATTYVAAPGSGDTTSAETLPLDPTTPGIQQWPLLTGVEVRAANAGTFVAFGSSITTGIGSTLDANQRWPDDLARRLQQAGVSLGVVNASIVANRILNDVDGQNAQARFDRDVLARPGVQYVLVTDEAGVDLIDGVNNAAQNPSVDALVAGLKQLILRAHSRGIKVFAGTILPVEGFIESADSRAKRLAVNAFLRSGAFDGVADFEKAVLDPADPYRILPALDSGDHHHPNDRGYRKMAKTVVPLLLGAEAADSSAEED